VRPVVGSVVMSLTLKTPICMVCLSVAGVDPGSVSTIADLDAFASIDPYNARRGRIFPRRSGRVSLPVFPAALPAAFPPSELARA